MKNAKGNALACDAWAGDGRVTPAPGGAASHWRGGSGGAGTAVLESPRRGAAVLALCSFGLNANAAVQVTPSPDEDVMTSGSFSAAPTVSEATRATSATCTGSPPRNLLVLLAPVMDRVWTAPAEGAGEGQRRHG